MPVPVLAYWYDGGRPSGALPWFMASEVVEAAGGGEVVGLVGPELVVVKVGTEVWEELVLLILSAGPVVPLAMGAAAGGEATAAADGGGVERLVWEELLVAACDEDLRVEPTSFRNLVFIR